MKMAMRLLPFRAINFIVYLPAATACVAVALVNRQVYIATTTDQHIYTHTPSAHST